MSSPVIGDDGVFLAALPGAARSGSGPAESGRFCGPFGLNRVPLTVPLLCRRRWLEADRPQQIQCRLAHSLTQMMFFRVRPPNYRLPPAQTTLPLAGRARLNRRPSPHRQAASFKVGMMTEIDLKGAYRAISWARSQPAAPRAREAISFRSL